MPGGWRLIYYRPRQALETQRTQQTLSPANFIIAHAQNGTLQRSLHPRIQSSKKKATQGPFVLLPIRCRKVTALLFQAARPRSESAQDIRNFDAGIRSAAIKQGSDDQRMRQRQGAEEIFVAC